MRLSRAMLTGRGGLIAAVLFLFLFAPLAAQAQVETVDDLGNRVVLPHPARRIVSLAPHNTENLFSAGAGQPDRHRPAHAAPGAGHRHCFAVEFILRHLKSPPLDQRQLSDSCRI